MKNIALLGASGSIGTSTLEVIKRHQDKFNLVAFSVFSKVGLIENILDTFKGVKIVAVRSLNEVSDLQLKYKNVTFIEGEKGLNAVATIKEADILVSALVGFVGLTPTINAIKQGKDIALANKETLVVAGDIIMDLARIHNVKILPVDSEHSAIYQCLEKENEVSKIILTASGGPFFKKSLNELEDVTLNDALNHPTWKMGNKITIDSATMFNKAFEVIEASHLFNLDASQIEVIIHPQSIIHSIVEFKDGAMKAQMGVSDMKVPIAYALSYPNRLDNIAISLSLKDVAKLEFYEADLNRFEPISLAYNALKEKGTYPAVLNAANEEAVNLFLNGKIKFTDILKIVKNTLSAHNNDEDVTLEKIYLADAWARDYVRRNCL